jgi:plastocyanin
MIGRTAGGHAMCGRGRMNRLVAAVLAAAFVLAGCGADRSDVPVASVASVPSPVVVAVTNSPQVVTTGVVVSVVAIDNTFRAADTAAHVGDTVRFTNKGKNDHDVLPETGSAWGVPIQGFHPGDVYSYVFTEPGVYAYYCSIHGTNHKGMIGTITVTG